MYRQITQDQLNWMITKKDSIDLLIDQPCIVDKNTKLYIIITIQINSTHIDQLQYDLYFKWAVSSGFPKISARVYGN